MKKLKLIIIFIFFLQLLFSITRVGYYLSKVIIADYKLLVLTDDQKRDQIYGASYKFMMEADKIDTDQLYIISNDGKPYFLGRYLLYPKKLYLISTNQELKRALHSESGNFLVYLPANQQLWQTLNGSVLKKKEVRSFDKELIGYIYTRI